MRRIDSFQVDFSRESHLILPFYTLPEDAIVLCEGDDVFIITGDYLFAVSDRDQVDVSSFLADRSIHHLLFPSGKERGKRRFLMKKETAEDVYTFLDSGLSDELAHFYQERTPFDIDREYLELRRDQGEVFFTVRKEDRIVSAAYTVKGRRQIVSLSTDSRLRNTGLGTLLLKNSGIEHLFCEGERLRRFYSERGYRTARTYCMINR